MFETKKTSSFIAVISLGLLSATIMTTAGTQSIWCLIIGIPFSLVVIRAIIRLMGQS